MCSGLHFKEKPGSFWEQTGQGESIDADKPLGGHVGRPGWGSPERATVGTGQGSWIQDLFGSISEVELTGHMDDFYLGLSKRERSRMRHSSFLLRIMRHP